MSRRAFAWQRNPFSEFSLLVRFTSDVLAVPEVLVMISPLMGSVEVTVRRRTRVPRCSQAPRIRDWRRSATDIGALSSHPGASRNPQWNTMGSNAHHQQPHQAHYRPAESTGGFRTNGLGPVGSPAKRLGSRDSDGIRWKCSVRARR